MTQRCSLSSTTGRWILLATTLASGTSFLMGTAVIVALPAIQTYFRTSITSIQWIVNAYLLSLAALLLIGGSLGDRSGRRRILISGIIVFATDLPQAIKLELTLLGLGQVASISLVDTTLLNS